MAIIMEMYRTTNQSELEVAKKRVFRMKKFFNHCIVFSVGLVLYFAKTYFGAPLNFFPIRYLTETIMWIWTFIIATQGLKLFLIENVLDASWEKKQIEKIMSNQKNKGL
jgi:hypothetical protein